MAASEERKKAEEREAKRSWPAVSQMASLEMDDKRRETEVRKGRERAREVREGRKRDWS